jgi:uncharacterized damage-inducible protein DinB
MKLTELFAGELEREAPLTRRLLERMPEGRGDWKPHEKSMPFGRLASLVANMGSWVTMTVLQEELDLEPVGGQKQKPAELRTARELVETHDGHVAKAREALLGTNDDHLMKPWRLKVAGKIVQETPRYVMLRDSVLNHWAHHRGQLTVYYRLNDILVPSIYGPTADDQRY